MIIARCKDIACTVLQVTIDSKVIKIKIKLSLVEIACRLSGPLECGRAIGAR
jgi:hypothetical protein